ncbi:TrmB family transcriptional regulator [Rubrobacter marinus]|uniref:TrmB family transcriptional regulator n=1 Tax=Rubrobacter marinus TaxID=2653852 RepID=A0A6G8PWP5_9ACTN|nr:TrmB family transcriptional regulator [Rubrobacter marinus]QIN78567.1 TrmB family transcriptional regulator [Rubrobacter marinus]
MEGSPLIPALGDLGFTPYESKVYLALLRESPLSGYGIARASGVPRSKVYEVLRGMVGRGEVLVSHGDPVRYAPLPARELILARRRKAEESLRVAEEGLERYAAETNPSELIWDITGRAEILARAREVIGRAEGSLLLQVWREDAPELRDDLAEAAGRGVEVTVVAYGEPDYPFARIYLHDLAEEITKQFGGRWIILSADAREIVAGIVSLGGESRAAWSSHPGMVVPITEQIRHDLYIAEMLLSHRETLEASFGPSLVRLREKFGGAPIAGVASLLETRVDDGA